MSTGVFCSLFLVTYFSGVLVLARCAAVLRMQVKKTNANKKKSVVGPKSQMIFIKMKCVRSASREAIGIMRESVND